MTANCLIIHLQFYILTWITGIKDHPNFVEKFFLATCKLILLVGKHNISSIKVSIYKSIPHFNHFLGPAGTGEFRVLIHLILYVSFFQFSNSPHFLVILFDNSILVNGHVLSLLVTYLSLLVTYLSDPSNLLT